ncbi:hypothetical protein ES703_72392 [subsurface metagenome]
MPAFPATVDTTVDAGLNSMSLASWNSYLSAPGTGVQEKDGTKLAPVEPFAGASMSGISASGASSSRVKFWVSHHGL